jgi:acyl-CoA thioester hydrolase
LSGAGPRAVGSPQIPFSFPIRVYWEDTDGGGVVYHAGYLRFLERARTEWLRAHGIGQEALRASHDIVFAVRSVRMEFLAPARLDDLLVATVVLAEARSASLRFHQTVRRESDARVMVEAEVRAACLAASTFRPRPIPPGLIPTREMPGGAAENKKNPA